MPTQIIFQTGLALLHLHQQELLQMPFESLLANLSGKRFASLTETPGALIECALQFEYVVVESSVHCSLSMW